MALSRLVSKEGIPHSAPKLAMGHDRKALVAILSPT